MTLRNDLLKSKAAMTKSEWEAGESRKSQSCNTIGHTTEVLASNGFRYSFF